MLNLTNNYDFIFGSRYLKNGKSDDDTFLTVVGNYIFSKIGKIFFNIQLSDILYTYVIGNTSKFKELDVISNDFSFCVEFPIKVEKKKFSYIDSPSHERSRISGKKNVNEFIDGFKILLKIIKLFFKQTPIYLFCTLFVYQSSYLITLISKVYLASPSIHKA